MREMKDSGVDVLKEIPTTWSVIKTKYVADLYTGNSIKDEEKDYYTDSEDAIPYIATKDITQSNNTIDYTNGLYVKEKDSSFVHAYPESSLMCIEGGSAGRKKAYLDREVCFVNKLCCFKPKKIKGKYLYYYLNSPNYEEEFRQYISGLIGGVSKSKLDNILIVEPDPTEQDKIVEYLDRKCSAIDNIISKQEQIIEKLKEYKLSLITEAVTKGLDPNVEMKDSGDKRIGSIPKSWNRVKITRILDYNQVYPMGDGDHGLIKTDDYKEAGIPYIRVQNLGWGTDLLLDNIVYISDEDNAKIKNSELHPGDVLFCKTGATIGKTGMIPDDVPVANTTSHVGKMTIDKKYNARFVFYFLSSEVGYELFWDIACMKSTRPELSIEETRAINVVIPQDRFEQDKIVSFLDSKCKTINDSIIKKSSIIEMLKEYKKSLIYEVVTGKKEV